MIPWREQLTMGRRAVMFLFWPGEMPLWAHLVFVVCQVTVVAALIWGSLWIFAATITLTIGLGLSLDSKKPG